MLLNTCQKKKQKSTKSNIFFHEISFFFVFNFYFLMNCSHKQEYQSFQNICKLFPSRKLFSRTIMNIYNNLGSDVTDIIFSYYVSINIGENDVSKLKSHVYFTHFPSFIMVIQNLWTTSNQKTLNRCFSDSSEPEVYKASHSTAPCKQKKFIMEVKTHYQYLKSSCEYFVFLVCSTVSDLFFISFASLFFEFDFQLEQDLQLFMFAKKKNLCLTAYQSVGRANLHHALKLVEIKQTKKTIFGSICEIAIKYFTSSKDQV